MLLGRAFHKVAAATTNELSPTFTCVCTTVYKLLFAERNVLTGCMDTQGLIGIFGHRREIMSG